MRTSISALVISAVISAVISVMSPSTAMAVALGACADLPDTRLQVASAAITGDFVGTEPFVIKDGQIVVNDDKAMVSRSPSDNKDVYRYKVDLGDGVFETRTLEITRDAKGNLAIRRMNDLDSQMAYAKKKGIYIQGQEKTPQAAGVESQFSSSENKCRLEQASLIQQAKVGGKTLTSRDVYWDSVYCDRLQKALNEKGREKVQECSSILESAQRIFNARQNELLKENKVLQASRGEGFMSAAVKISLCAPEEWNMRLRTLVTGGAANAGTKEKPVAAPAATQATDAPAAAGPTKQ
jgi:hypothetical protein